MKKQITDNPYPTSVAKSIIGNNNVQKFNSLSFYLNIPNEKCVLNLLKEIGMRNLEKENSNISSESPKKEIKLPTYNQHAENITNINYTGDCDIITNEEEIKRLNSEIKNLRKLLKEKENENLILKEEISLLKELKS